MLSQILLQLLGWNPKIIINEPNNKPFIGVFSQTSEWDYILYSLYYHSNLELKNKCILIPPKYYRKWLYNSVNGVEQSPTEPFYNNIKHYIQVKHLNGCILSPTRNGVWTDEYKKLAKELNWNIRVIGFDYEHKCGIISKSFSNDTDNKIKEYMTSIVPYNLNDANIPIRNFNSQKHGLFSISNIIIFILITIVIYVLFLYIFKKV